VQDFAGLGVDGLGGGGEGRPAFCKGGRERLAYLPRRISWSHRESPLWSDHNAGVVCSWFSGGVERSIAKVTLLLQARWRVKEGKRLTKVPT